MESPHFKPSWQTGAPLFPLTPERVNGTRSGHGNIPQSPSLPEFLKPGAFTLNPGSPPRRAHNRHNSEALVQGMVARFDSLSLKDHQQMHKRDEAAIMRAEMAREMAEKELVMAKKEREERDGEARKYREECRRLKRETEEGKDRERKLMKRLAAQEDMIERSSQTQEHQKTALEKQNRKLTKEAYKMESELIKRGEELKSTRNSLRIAQSSLESEKAKSFKREQEAFTAQYKFVGLEEEANKLRERIGVLEQERDALKTNLKEEEVARIAAEGRIALPAALDDEGDEFASPRKSPRKRFVDSEDKENVIPRKTVETKALQEEVDLQRRLRLKAEEQVEFMKMECQFLCCSCRVAELNDAPYVHDDRFRDEIERLKSSIIIDTRPVTIKHEDDEDGIPMDSIPECETGALDSPRSTTPLRQTPPPVEAKIEFSPTSGTFKSVRTATVSVELSTEETMSEAPQVQTHEDGNADDTMGQKHASDADMANPSYDQPSSPSKEPVSDFVLPPQTPHAPHTPKYREVRTVTTTTTIPLAFTPYSANHSDDRQAAIQTPVTIGHVPVLNVPLSQFQAPGIPTAALLPDGTLDREAALEQIRLRRGRTRSMAMGLGTPRKQMIEGVARRDISAPALKGR